jgi:hypothetical protein
MSARAPRRHFASPFVITLASVPACTTANPTPPTQTYEPVANPPRPTEIAVEPDPEPTPPPAPEPAPAPEPEPEPVDAKPAARERRWTVMHPAGSKECKAFLDSSCPSPPPGQPMPSCNPPPPTKYACPDWLAEGETVKIVLRAGATDCFTVPAAPRCPPQTRCNPPPPRKVACPS